MPRSSEAKSCPPGARSVRDRDTAQITKQRTSVEGGDKRDGECVERTEKEPTVYRPIVGSMSVGRCPGPGRSNEVYRVVGKDPGYETQGERG